MLQYRSKRFGARAITFSQVLDDVAPGDLPDYRVFAGVADGLRIGHGVVE